MVEDLCEGFPDIGITVLFKALVIEPIDLGYICPLVVPAQQSNPLRVSHFQRKQQAHHLHALVSSVHVISTKEVVRVWNAATDRE